MVTRTLVRRARISSLGFSGAGFLASYHLGVVHAWQQQQLPDLPVTGVSAGALVAASVAAGVPDGMETVLAIAQQTRQQARGVLQPGFSLVDVLETHVRQRWYATVDGDSDEFIRRLHRCGVRIGLTDRRIWPQPQAEVWVHQFRDIDDVVAACILSSYVPGVTGPIRGSGDVRNNAVFRANQRLHDMVQAGCVTTRGTVPVDAGREVFWDGGLVNAFPTYDRDTVIVTPIAADFTHNASINPSIAQPSSTRKLAVNPNLAIHLTMGNLHTFLGGLLSPDQNNLESFFAQGYDGALKFLNQRGLLRVFQSAGPCAGDLPEASWKVAHDGKSA